MALYIIYVYIYVYYNVCVVQCIQESISTLMFVLKVSHGKHPKFYPVDTCSGSNFSVDSVLDYNWQLVNSYAKLRTCKIHLYRNYQ